MAFRRVLVRSMAAIVPRRRLKALASEPLVRFRRGETRIGFMRARFFGIGLSILLSLGSVALFVHPGLSYGIDFKGGIQMDVEGSAPIDVAGLRAALGGPDLGEVQLQGAGTAGAEERRVGKEGERTG